MLRARAEKRRGQEFAAAESALRAWRADPDGFVEARRDWCRRLMEEACFQGGALGPISTNRLLAQYVKSSEANGIRRQFAPFPVADKVRLRYPRTDDDPERQGDLILLKEPALANEKGVIFVKYSEAFRRLASMFDLARLAESYQIVLEPSWWGYQDATFWMYLGCDLDAVVLAQRKPDFDFIRGLATNLVPVRLGAGDWVDGDTFQPLEDADRDFDVVMVAGWSPMKRHETLFRALRELARREARELRVALIGYPQGWPRAKIESLMNKYGVSRQCIMFEQIPHDEVARIVARAHVSVVLSRREGANKALYESLFCDTPVILLRDQRGVNLDHITPEIGLFTDEEGLGQSLLAVVDSPGRFRPRAWAMAHTGWRRSTEILNELLRDLAQRRGLPWSCDIEPKKNAPNLRYTREGVYRRFDGAYAGLEEYLLPVTF